jgi:hypothetical protein
MSDLYKTLLISRPQVLSSGGSGLLVAANNLSDVADVTTARTNLGAASALTVGTLPSTLSSRGYIYSDGVTTNRAQIQLPGTRGNLAGAPVASWVGWVDIPTSISSASCFIASLSSTASANNSTVNQLSLWTTNTGSLFIRANGATGSDTRTFSLSTFVVTYSGQRIWLEVRFTKGTSNPVVRVNGTDISSSFTASTAGTAPEWLDVSLSSTNHLVGLNWPAGPAPIGQWLNAHLTDTESETWRTTGRPPVWVEIGGSAVDVKPTSSSFAYWFGTGTVVSSTATQVVAAAGAVQLNVRNPALTVTPIAGAKVRFNVTVSGLTGTATIQLSTYSVSATSSTITSDGTYELDVTTTTSGQLYVVIAISSTTQAPFTINSAKLFGALSIPSIQPIPVIDDATGIEGNQARLLGMIPVTERKDWRIVDSTATSGNEQILGGATFLEANRHRIDSWVINNLGTSKTVSLGNASAGTQYASSITAAAGLTEVTLSTRFNATTALWVNSNGTDQLVHTITGHRVGSS